MIKKVARAFTLVELIVVITILAILGTIGFISLQGYTVSARETTRISDLATIQKALELFYTTESYFPEPTDVFSVTYSGSLAWQQGNFGEDTRSKIGRISQVPVDPLTQNPYAYSLINTKQEYELGAMSESPLASALNITDKSYAATNYYTNIKGNYNKKIVTVSDSSALYILGVPTLITSEIQDVTVQQIFDAQSFAIQGSNTLPGSYTNFLPNGENIKDGVSFTPGTIVGTNAPLIYQGTPNSLSDDAQKQIFVENLVSYYKNSNLGSNGPEDVMNMASGNELTYINTLIKNNTGGIPGAGIVVNTAVNTSPYTGVCRDMTNSNKLFSGLITGFSDNMWNPQGNGTGSFPEDICLDYDINTLPSPSQPWVIDWSIPGAGGNVIAYPNVYYGHKPWENSTSGAYGDQILDRNISFSYAYNIIADESYNNIYNTSLNLWLTSTQTANASAVEAEVMVWTENTGLTPLGAQVASGISIGGQTYNLYRANNVTDTSGIQPGSWNYFAFVNASTQRAGTLPVRDFLQYLVTNQGLNSNLYLHQVEYGPEIVEGKAALSFTQATVSGLGLVPVSPFSFPPVSYSSNDISTRVTSQYVDIGNLTEIPRTFSVSSSDSIGNAVATGNIVGGEIYAANGELIYGTALEVDIPNAGETRTVSLDVGGVVGTWQVSRTADTPSPFQGFSVNDFTTQSGVTFYQLIFGNAGIPAANYNFSISGTNNTNPRLQEVEIGSTTNGTTKNWGFSIDVDLPPSGVQGTITFVIDGQTVSWVITG